MKRNLMFSLFTLVIVATMLLAACQPAATTTPAPVEPTKPVVVEEPTKVPEEVKPTEPPAETFEGISQSAPDCNYGGNMKSIEAVDAMTVKFTLCAPDPAFLPKIAVPAFPILDYDFIKETGGNAAQINDNPVGTGPYIIKEWVRGDHITFVPNPTYWDTPAVNTEFILRWNKEAAARLLDLQSGNINGMDNVGTDDFATVEADANLKLYPRTFNNFLYLGIQNETPPWDNEKVRQALAMAIDKEAIVRDFYPAGATAATQFVPPGVKPGYTEGYSAPGYDPEKAKEILTGEGFDFSKEYVLSYAERTRPYFPQPTKIAQAVQAQLAEIGINIKLNLMEWAAYLPLTREGGAELFFLGWSEDFPDATNWYDVFLTGSSDSFGKPWPDIVEQIKIGATSGDPAVRQAAYDKVNELVDQHVPTITIANGATSLAFDAAVENVVIGAYNENFQEMKTESGILVFSQDGEPVSLDCADETDGSSFLACRQLFDTLYRFKFGSTEAEPALAEVCEPNADATEYTCKVREGVKFSNGAALDANDIAASFIRSWDVANEFHVGNTGSFQYMKDFFGPKALNEPPAP